MANSVTEAPSLTPAKLVPLIITLAVGVTLWFIPPPEGVKQDAWHLLAIFVATIVGIISRPLPMGAAALVGLSVLVLAGVLSWQDILQEKGAWDTIVWFAALVMMATQLNKLGFIPWFGDAVGGQVQGLAWTTAFLILALVYFYSHYLFASQTAHISAMYAPFLAVAIAVGTPAVLAALVLAYFSNLFSSLTHYANGPAPVVFGTGYVSMGAWWGIGGAVSVINILIWVGVGSVWWNIIGLM